jgi:hypothetical protein
MAFLLLSTDVPGLTIQDLKARHNKAVTVGEGERFDGREMRKRASQRSRTGDG